LVAEKRALHGEFKAYWKKTAQDIAIKNNIDIEDVKQNLELYDARNYQGRSVH
tara:strand:+ start:304 stop:462 length:159 start_codon:yes stop_codon:yes gene_type:complete